MALPSLPRVDDLHRGTLSPGPPYAVARGAPSPHSAPAGRACRAPRRLQKSAIRTLLTCLPEKILETPSTPFIHRRKHRPEPIQRDARRKPDAAPHLHLAAKGARAETRSQLGGRSDWQRQLRGQQRPAEADIEHPDPRPKIETAFDSALDISSRPLPAFCESCAHAVTLQPLRHDRTPPTDRSTRAMPVVRTRTRCQSDTSARHRPRLGHRHEIRALVPKYPGRQR